MTYNEKTNYKDKKKIRLSLRQYYYLALWLPIIVPPFLLVYPFNNTSETKISLFFYGIIFGVIQYLAFALWALFKYRDGTTAEIKMFSFKAPISFVKFYAGGFIIAHIFSNISLPTIDVMLILLVLSLLCIPIGYFYVALAHIIGRILEKIGFIEE